MSEVLRMKDVTKTYGKQTVLNKVNLCLEEGEIMGLVGPNGAGKTTLMKIITTRVRKYDGEVYINDENIKEKKNHNTKQIGCVIETPGFYPDLTGYDNLQFFAEISGVRDKDEINEIVKELGIEDYVGKKVKKYSLGMKQRLGIAQAVLTYPPILVLDEPTNGLDPAIVPQLRKFIKYLAEKKHIAVLISSHILSEIEQMCDKVAFIQKGKIVKIEDLNNNEKELTNIEISTSKLEKLIGFFNERKLDYKVVGKDKLQSKINSKELETLVLEIAKENIPLRGVNEIKESLEKRYLRTMGDDKNV